MPTWRRFQGRLTNVDLVSLLLEDAAAVDGFEVPFSPRQVDRALRVDRLPEPLVDRWLTELPGLRLDAPGAEYIAGQARLLGLSSRLARSELHVVKPRQRVLELPGTGGQLAHHLVSTQEGITLQDNLASEAAEEALRGEYDALTTLDHPNVVHVIDLSKMVEGRLTLVMERVGGTNLRRWLLDNPRPTRRPSAASPKTCSPASTTWSSRGSLTGRPTPCARGSAESRRSSGFVHDLVVLHGALRATAGLVVHPDAALDPALPLLGFVPSPAGGEVGGASKPTCATSRALGYATAERVVMVRSISVADFEADPGSALQATRAGERVVITSRGAPVAELVPLRSAEDVLDELARTGRLQRGDRSVLMPGGARPADRLPLDHILQAGDWDAG